MEKKTVLHQLQTMEKTLDGMSYVIEAEDGSLIVIDGGMDEDADPLYEYLKKLCGGKEPVVDLWIITHAHADHYNCMMTVAERHGHEITVKKVMFDFPEKSFFEWIEPVVLRELERFERAVSLFKGMEVTVPHSGDRYRFGQTRIEILYTASDLPPFRGARIPQTTNDGSLVFRLVASGQSVLFLGDVQKAGNEVLIQRYGDALKSDVCQVAHHGHFSSTSAFYDLVDPEILLWPVRASALEELASTVEASYHLLANLRVKDVILAGHGSRRLELPITASVAPFLPKITPRHREVAAQLSIPEASRPPRLSDPLDAVWQEGLAFDLTPCMKTQEKGVCAGRLLWRDDALFIMTRAVHPIIPSEPSLIGTGNSNNLRLSYSEEATGNIFLTWDACPKEGFIEKLKFYPDEKHFAQGWAHCSEEDRCEYRVFTDGDAFTVCVRLPFETPKQKGDFIGLNLEFTLMDADGYHRKVWEMLQTGELAMSCGSSPSVLCYVRLG